MVQKSNQKMLSDAFNFAHKKSRWLMGQPREESFHKSTTSRNPKIQKWVSQQSIKVFLFTSFINHQKIWYMIQHRKVYNHFYPTTYCKWCQISPYPSPITSLKKEGRYTGFFFGARKLLRPKSKPPLVPPKSSEVTVPLRDKVWALRGLNWATSKDGMKMWSKMLDKKTSDTFLEPKNSEDQFGTIGTIVLEACNWWPFSHVRFDPPAKRLWHLAPSYVEKGWLGWLDVPETKQELKCVTCVG